MSRLYGVNIHVDTGEGEEEKMKKKKLPNVCKRTEILCKINDCQSFRSFKRISLILVRIVDISLA